MVKQLKWFKRGALKLKKPFSRYEVLWAPLIMYLGNYHFLYLTNKSFLYYHMAVLSGRRIIMTLCQSLLTQIKLLAKSLSLIYFKISQDQQSNLIYYEKRKITRPQLGSLTHIKGPYYSTAEIQMTPISAYLNVTQKPGRILNRFIPHSVNMYLVWQNTKVILLS